MQSFAAYFDLPDAAALNWAHRVNTGVKLHEALADPFLHVIECDIQFSASDATPLVAEPGTEAELELAEVVVRANAAGKALKLDFHTPAAVEPALTVLSHLRPTAPVMLHADVFSLLGEGNAAEPMEPEQFIRLCQQAWPKAVLSIGWSLRRTHDADGRVEDALIHQCAGLALQQLGPVNYGLEIRAGYTPGAGGGRAEHGAALIFDPLPPAPSPEYERIPTPQSGNVVNFTARLRHVA